MEYFELTDPLRSGDVILADRQRFYRYSFGPDKWVKTTVLLPYLKEGSPLYRCFRSVTAQEARALLVKKSQLLARLLSQHRDPGMEPVTDRLPDQEEQLVALLHGPGLRARPLTQEPLPPQIRRAAELLMQPPGLPFRDYLTRVRKNRMARNVLIAILETILNGTAEEPYESARRYLSGQTDIFAPAAPAGNLTPAMEIYRAVCRQALEGRMAPHSVSNPVLRQRNGRWVLAFFVSIRSRRHLEEKAFPRPELWITADLRTGAILERIPCSGEEFSPQPYDRLYSVADAEVTLSAQEFHSLYSRLDRVRQGILAGGEPDRQLYDSYLIGILRGVPPDYQCFYRDLSQF